MGRMKTVHNQNISSQLLKYLWFHSKYKCAHTYTVFLFFKDKIKLEMTFIIITSTLK